MVYTHDKSYLIQIKNISIVEIGEKCGVFLSSVQEKGFHMYFGCFLVFGNSEDRFSHDMAHFISIFPCLKINIMLNKVS